MPCSRIGAETCCEIAGEVCAYLDDAGGDANPRWTCTLRAELGSWDAVHADARYLADVRPRLDAAGVTVDCGNWPRPGETCLLCGATGGSD